MNFFILLIVVVSAKKGWVIDVVDVKQFFELPAFTVIEPKQCHYLGTTFNKAGEELVKAGMPENARSVIVKKKIKGAQIKSYTDDKCTEGEHVVVSKDFNSYYTTIPEHAGFRNVGDDESCSHQENALRTYYRNDCRNITYQVNNMQVFVKMGETSRMFSLNQYYDGTCEMKTNQLLNLGFCDKCNHKENGEFEMVQCGSISTMILIVFLILAFLF